MIVWKYAFSRKSAFSYAMRLMLSILIVLMLLETAAFGAYHVLRTTGQEHMDENISVAENQMISKNTDGSDAKVSSDPDVIWYNGKAYRYNHDLVTMLVMGIDQESDTIEEKDDVSGESGQADTIFLMVMDKSKDEIKMISISRKIKESSRTCVFLRGWKGDKLSVHGRCCLQSVLWNADQWLCGIEHECGCHDQRCSWRRNGDGTGRYDAG